MKIYNKFVYINLLQFSTMPMKISEQFSIDKNEIVFDPSKTLYQQRICSLLFAVIVTKPDIAFVIS